MRMRLYYLLLLLVFLTAGHGSMVFAEEKKSLSAPVRLCVHWSSRSGQEARKSRQEFNENRSLFYQLERKGHGREKDKVRALWHL